MTKRHTFSLLCCTLLAVALASCQKFKGSQTVPAYIHIDSIAVEGDYYTYGANTANITDAWVYVDDQIIGTFELPATFPVLKKGKHKVSVYAPHEKALSKDYATLDDAIAELVEHGYKAE